MQRLSFRPDLKLFSSLRWTSTRVMWVLNRLKAPCTLLLTSATSAW